MSFGRWALRRTALEALRGQTIVGDNVLDSDFSALTFSPDGAARTPRQAPFVLIYTDDSEVDEASTRDLRQNGRIDFVCEFGVASPMVETDPNTGASTITGIELPLTDATMEATLDLIDMGITRALMGPGVWSDLWRSLSDSIVKIKRLRTASADDGVRLAARQLRITLEVKPDPVHGQALAATSPWRRVADAITAADPVLGDLVNRFLPGDPDVLVDVASRAQGLTEAERSALGTSWAREPGEIILGTEISDGGPT